MFKATAMDIITAYTNIKLLQTHLKSLLVNCDSVFKEDVRKQVSEIAKVGRY